MGNRKGVRSFSFAMLKYCTPPLQYYTLQAFWRLLPRQTFLNRFPQILYIEISGGVHAAQLMHPKIGKRRRKFAPFDAGRIQHKDIPHRLAGGAGGQNAAIVLREHAIVVPIMPHAGIGHQCACFKRGELIIRRLHRRPHQIHGESR